MTTTSQATETMTQAQLIETFRGLGCAVRPRSWDGIVDGAVVTRYGVDVTLSAMGSTEIETVREGHPVNPAAIVAAMQKALKARTSRTRGAIRRERRPT